MLYEDAHTEDGSERLDVRINKSASAEWYFVIKKVEKTNEMVKAIQDNFVYVEKHLNIDVLLNHFTWNYIRYNTVIHCIHQKFRLLCLI